MRTPPTRTAAVAAAALGFAAVLLVAIPGRALGPMVPPAAIPEAGRADLDGDGRADCWDATYSGGSGFGGTMVLLRPGCGKASWKLDTYGSLGDFLEAADLRRPVPRTPLLLGPMRLLYGAGAIRSLGDGARAEPDAAGAASFHPPIDGSFRWLVDAFQGANRRGRPPFPEVQQVRPSWVAGLPVLPPTQAVLLRDPTFARTARALDPAEPAPDLGFTKRAAATPFAVLGYRAHNHVALRELDRCGAWRVFATAHGVAVYDERVARHAWVWVVTGATKLRWSSVRAVHCLGELLVVERFSGSDVDLVVIDPLTGATGRIDAEYGPWRIERSALVLRSVAYPAAALAAALRPPADWASRSDLDGDALPDRVDTSFSGGAHCCYTLAVTLSSTGARLSLPFELDGGYVFGLDLSRPRHFDVADFDRDGILDLFLEIGTYGSDRLPLAPALARDWGIRTHEIVVSFASGRAVARDLGRL